MTALSPRSALMAVGLIFLGLALLFPADGEKPCKCKDGD